MWKLSWIIQVGSKGHHKCSCKGGRRKFTAERRQCDYRGRDWNDMASSQRMLKATRTRKSKEQVFPLSLQREHNTVYTSISVQGYWFLTFGPQNYEWINLCCFKAPSVCFKPPATRNEYTGILDGYLYFSLELSIYQQWYHYFPCHQSLWISSLLTSITKMGKVKEIECIFIPSFSLVDK